MSKIVREDIDNLHALLTATLTPEDYQPKVNSELQNYRKKASMKGFRKGKTPMGMIKKLYGKSVLGDVINEMLQNEITQYLKDENLEILGQPIPAKDQELFDLEEGGKDVVFRFEVGLAPKFELQGIDKDNKFSQYAVEIPSEMIDKDLDVARTRAGERKPVEGAILEGDMVKFNAEELDGDKVKKDGWASTFSVVVENRLEEALMEELLTKSSGDKIRFDINKVEKDRDETFVRKYLLNVTEADADVVIGDQFEATIEEITRVMPAEMTQEFFDKAFGEGKVTNEEEARARVEQEIVKFYDRQAESLLFRDFQDDLLEKNRMELPETFLRRWLSVANEMTPEAVDAEYVNFAKNLQWSMIRSKMVEKFNIEVKEEEVLEGFKDRIRGYFGGQGNELIVLNTANRLMEDKDQVDQLFQELMADKLFAEVRNAVTIEPNKTSMEDFEKVVQQAQAEMQARQNPPALETVEESTEEEVVDVEQE